MRGATVVLTLFLAAADPAGAQKAKKAVPPDTVTLERVEELVQLGRTEDARAALMGWWSVTRPKASRHDVQWGLWLRGRLTVDPSQAALDYRRLVVEYPGGPYSPQALFRLAQGAWESGDSAAAAQHVARLAREYPGSRVLGDAQAWLAAAGSPPAPPVGTPDTTAVPGAQVAAAPPTPAQDTAMSPGRYAVQLGAFSTQERAYAVERKARDAGFDVRLVRLPGSRLVHVRVGRFDSAAAAGELFRQLQSQGFTTAVVPDANREERIRR